jgi:predicted ferric reductase
VTVRALILVGGVLVLAMWWASTPASFAATPGALTTAIGDLSGLLGGYLVCAQVLLIARVPWFERSVGMDKLVLWHRTLGTTVVFLILTHVVFIVLGSMLLDNVTPWSALVLTLTAFPDMLTALIGTIAILVVGLSSARLIRQHLSYEVWYWLHVTTYVAIFLTFFHQISGGTHFVDNPINRFAWIILYLATGSAVVWWRFLLPLSVSWRHRLRVDRLVVENSGTTSVWFSGRSLEELGIRAGQFMLFRFLSWGHFLTAHPYSISRVPSEGYLRITVGALGDHSGAIGRLRPGTLVFAEGPFGHFTADKASRVRILLIAGGAGIGPIRALAEELVAREHDVVLIYRARSTEQLALIEELESMPRLTLIPLVGRREQLGYDPLSSAGLQAAVPDVREREVFVCGPEGMAVQSESSLRALHVSRRFIHREVLSMS